MLIYILLIISILLGGIALKINWINKKIYCIVICIFFITITGFRSKYLGMYDTYTVYLPSFNVISQNTLMDIFKMNSTQYGSIGFVIFSKIISLISKNEQFFIFVTSMPFYLAISRLIYKFSENPMLSFIVVLGMNYLTYSFSMIRGMLAFCFLCLALEAALENKWLYFYILVLVASMFHITALAFICLPILSKINWDFFKISVAALFILLLNTNLSTLWNLFVEKIVSRYISNYRYYGTKGGELADSLLIVYLVVMMFYIFIEFTSRDNKNIIKFNQGKLVIKKHNLIIQEDRNTNMLIGSALCACICIFMTQILSEMIRIGMTFGIADIIMVGYYKKGTVNRYNKIIYGILNTIEIFLLIAYFVLASLKNMNSLPYQFFWNI